MSVGVPPMANRAAVGVGKVRTGPNNALGAMLDLVQAIVVAHTQAFMAWRTAIVVMVVNATENDMKSGAPSNGNQPVQGQQ
jgi:hypothetical protein